MTKPAASRLAQAASGIFAGILLGMLIEVIWFWPAGDWPPPRQFILRFSNGVRLPVVGPFIGAACLAVLGAVARGVTLHGMVRALAIGVSAGAFVGVFGGMVLGAVLSAARDRRLAEAGFHIAEGAGIDKFSLVDGLMIGVIGGALLGGVVGTVIEVRSRHLHPPAE